MLGAIDSRRQKSLALAIKVFNRNQDVQLKSWGLNVEKNPATVDQTSFEYASIKNKQKPEFLGNFGVENKPLYAKAQVSHDEISMIEKSESIGYLIEDDVSLNAIVDRYEKLLSDMNSPIVSNFMNLMDYHDGRDMPKLSKDLKVDMLMNRYLQQAEQLEKLTLQVNRMSMGLRDVYDKLDDKVNQDFSPKPEWKEKREFMVQHLVDK